MTPNSSADGAARELYLNLMERCLLNTIYEDAYTNWRDRGIAQKFDAAMRQLGRDWPSVAHTMIGQVRLRNLRNLAEQAIADGVPGDFIETGVWRGGACILLRAVLKAHGIADRRVFVADSFEGLPPPDPANYPADAGDVHYQLDELAVSIEQVKSNFAKYDLLDEQVVFLKGWFKDSLPIAPIDRLAVLRLDGDMYESTMDGLKNLYDKVSPGGFIIVDDYGCVAGCKAAITDFRRDRGITEPIIDIDGWGVYWRKPFAETVTPLIAQDALAPVAESAPRPFWSVIIPVYGREQYLKQCLTSVLQQDPGPSEMEITVVDDAGPVDLRGVVEAIGQGRVKYHRNATTLGLYPSTNEAIRRSRGRWIHILHDDDWVLSGFYEAMRSGVQSAPNGVGVAFCMYSTHDERLGTTWSPPPFRNGPGILTREFLARLAMGNPLNLPAVVFGRHAFEAAGLFREDLPYTADWEWYVRSAPYVGWHHQPETLACYRMHASNQTHDLARSGRTARDVRRTLETFAHTLPADVAAAVLPAARASHAQQLLDGVFDAVQSGDAARAAELTREALALDPDAAGRAEFARLLQDPTHPSLRLQVREDLLRRLK
jgi:O-methyltransferase/8-demethyl-8-(2,3-dimethoxy-alpha-L-rhamnosyl)tetracenomycin-C 4'-O-methyltransferase